MTAVGAREKALFSQSLAPLLAGLQGHETVVELKNGVHIFGRIEIVDCFINVTMENVLMTRPDGSCSKFNMFFVQMKNIRYVHIPDHVSIMSLLSKQLDIITGKAAQEERRKRMKKRAAFLRNRQIRNAKNEEKERQKLNVAVEK